MGEVGPRNRSVQEIENYKHFELSPETIASTPVGFDTSRKGFYCGSSTQVAIRIKNTGAFSADVQIEASIDGATFDVTVQPGVPVAAGSHLVARISNEVNKRIRVLVKSSVMANPTSVAIHALGA